MLLNECPKCSSRNINVRREVGCFFMILVFISFGIGLVMFPFLPRIGKCNDCGCSWKA